MNTIKIDKKNSAVQFIGHKGLAGLEAENTRESFVAAANRSYYGIETDVRVTADGKIVCMHDDVFSRIAGIDGLYVEQSSFDEARKVALKDYHGNINPTLHIPSYEEYIDICKKYEKVAVTELKGAFTKENVKKAIDIIAERDYLDNVVFISFDYQSLVYVKELVPEQKVQFLVNEIKDDLLEKLKSYNMDLDIYYKLMLDKKNVELFKNNGIKVNVWTCDDPEEAKILVENGVDYITSDILE